MSINVYWACVEDEWMRAESPEKVSKRFYERGIKDKDFLNPAAINYCPSFNTELKNPTEAKEGARAMASKMVKSKLSRKPGNDNYLANVLPNGSMKFFQISFEKLDNDENLLDNFAAKQSAIYLDFGKIFG